MDDIQFFTSQLGGEEVVSHNHSLSPTYRFWSDICSFFENLFYLPNIILPFLPLHHGMYDELDLKDPYNLLDMFLHFILVILQLGFCFVLIPFCLIVPMPGWVSLAIMFSFLVANKTFCLLLNGFKLTYFSSPELVTLNPAHEREQWIFLNGVAVGRHWLQNNIDRLALTFGRPVMGIHNKTSGILFDVFQCLVQRNLDYNTSDIRHCYTVVKSKLYSPKYDKVVFIMHSQGAIEGSMIIDWLLQEVPQDLLLKLEVYTFGAAANHFNNPYTNRAMQARASLMAESKGNVPAIGKSLRHVEHYANKSDFVARWGVLNFTKDRAKLTAAIAKQSEPTTAAFMGRVFARPGRGGHQLNQHYLDIYFPLYVPEPTPDDPKPRPRCDEKNAFMEMRISHLGKGPNGFEESAHGVSELLTKTLKKAPSMRENVGQAMAGTSPTMAAAACQILDMSSPISRLPVAGAVDKTDEPLKVKHFSRLWLYRNGQSPADDDYMKTIKLQKSGTL